METLKLNNTPVRTSRNFGINNIELKDIELPEDLKEFKNVEIINEGCSLEKSISNKIKTNHHFDRDNFTNYWWKNNLY